MKLSTVRIMKRLRIWVLVLVHLSGSCTLFSASFSTLALGGSGRTFWTQGTVPHVTASGPGINLLPVILAAGTLSLLMFHNVCPVTLSISPRMILESCALKVGFPIGFSAVITRAGVAVPLPPPPLSLLPHPGRLGSVVAHMLHPLEGMPQCINVDLMIGQSFGVDNK